ncbi:beta strand repeat-containing protein, partial [Schlesneria paludicola]|uniref:beta strand repeat-containing protein n=1 Tax=Schlesneria paludicola TaxID=360056 RepID=UPI00029A9767
MLLMNWLGEVCQGRLRVRPRRCRRSIPSAQAIVQVESLEQRRMLAADLSAAVVGTVLTVTEANTSLGADNNVTLKYVPAAIPGTFDLHLIGAGGTTINGVTDFNVTTAYLGPFTSISIDTGGGSDKITLDSTSQDFAFPLGIALVGGTGDDTYAFSMNSGLGAVSIADPSGNDTLDFSSSTTALAVNLGITSAQAVNANLNLTLASGASIENVIGGLGNDKFTGNTLDNTFTSGGGTDTYYFNTSSQLGADTIVDSTGKGTIDFTGSTPGVALNLGLVAQQIVNPNLKLTLSSATGIQNVIGGLGNDKLTGNTLDNTFTSGGGAGTYYFNTSSQLGADTIVDSTGKGTIDFTGSTPGVALNLGLVAQQIVNPNLKLTLSSATGIQNVIGGLGNDKLTGNTLNNTFTSGGGADTYYFNTSSQLGADTIIDGTTKGTIDFTGSTPGVTLNLGSTAQQNVNSNLKLTLSSATGIQNVIGGAGNDKFTGNTLDNTFTSGGGADTYYFNTSSQLGADTIVDNTGKGTIDFTGSTPAVTVNLGSTAQQNINSNLKLTLTSATGIQNVVGGLGNDKLTGNTLDNTFTSGGGADTYNFNTSSQLGADTIVDSTGKGTIDFTGSTPGVALNLGSVAQQIVNPNLKLTLSSATGIQNVIGGLGNDKLTGNTLDNTFTSGGGADTYYFKTSSQLGADTIIDSTGKGTIDFTGSTPGVTLNLGSTAQQNVNSNLKLTLSSATGIQNVIGGLGNDKFTGNALDNTFTNGGGIDTYYFNTSSQLGADTIIDSTGRGTVDFTGSTPAVTVNLGSTAQQNVNSNLKLTLSSATGIQNVIGGLGNDKFTGNALDNTFTNG